MAAYSIGTTNNDPMAASGVIEIQISDDGGGGGGQYAVSLLACVQHSAFSFTGGNPAASSTFGNNGARWNAVQVVIGGQPSVVQYNWTRSVIVKSAYALILLMNDQVIDVWSGNIPGPSTVP
jgi:hypothetical protein